MNFTNEFIRECSEVITKLNSEDVEAMVDVLYLIREKKGRLFLIGSGGGAGHASHAVCDFRKLCNFETTVIKLMYVESVGDGCQVKLSQNQRSRYSKQMGKRCLQMS